MGVDICGNSRRKRGLKRADVPLIGVRMPTQFDDDDEYGDDDGGEDPRPSDMDADGDGDDSPTNACPHCGEEMYEFADDCPACGRSVSEADRGRTNHAGWVIVTAVGLVLLMLYGVAKLIF